MESQEESSQEMPLQVCLALSGLSREVFHQCEELFDQGAEIVNKQLTAPLPPPPIGLRPTSRTPSTSTSSTSSRSSSRSSSPATKGSVSGSVTPDISTEYPQWFPPQLSLRDYCMFRIDMVESDKKSKFDMLQVYDEAVKSSKPKDKTPEVEPKGTAAKDVPFNVVSEVNWQGRNLLDLGSNLANSNSLVRPATIPRGIASYFSNRSQISRLNGAKCPPSYVNKCSCCGFEEPVYY